MQAAGALAGRQVWVMAKGFHPDEGGMQTYAAGVAEAYAVLGAEVTVFTQTSAGPRDTAHGNLRLVDTGPGGGAATLRRLLSALRAERKVAGAPLFVHGTTWRTSVVPMLLGLPYLTTFHGREFMRTGAAAHAVMRTVGARALRAVAVSHYSASRLLERLPGVVPTVAHNGASVMPHAATPPKDGEPPLIFSLCRLEPRKNIGACLHALARLRDRGFAFRYVVAGRGPQTEQIKALVHELALEDCVTLAGFVPEQEALRLYRAAKIFLHPQIAIEDGKDFEGFGIAIADAMVSECAVIAGAEGGAAEMIEPGQTGLVVDGRDGDALERAIEQLLADGVLRRSMALAARAEAESRFTWARHVSAILDSLPQKFFARP
jgi:phosphatidyl-myo-inositol dimannoside synthase